MKSITKNTVALIFGGRGYEHDVSVEGAKFVFPLIDRSRYKALPIYIKKSGEWTIPKGGVSASPEEIVTEKVDLEVVHPTFAKRVGGISYGDKFIPIRCAFPLLHGDYGEDGVIAGVLKNSNIPFIGCDVEAGALCSDKAYTKIVAEHLGIPTAKWTLGYGSTIASARRAKERAEKLFSYPMFIKPCGLGSSVGASPVRSESEFDVAYLKAARLGCGRVLIEELISIEKELECAYFATKGKELFTNLGQISCNSSFYDYSEKYSNASSARVDATSDATEKITEKIKEYSKLLTDIIGIRDIARIDYFLTRDGEIIFNEINTMPGFTGGSLYPRLLETCGINPSRLVNLLISNRIRYGAQRR